MSKRNKRTRDSYLRSRYKITFDDWDSVCRFYGNRCLYPGCKFSGDVFTLSVDHVYPKHLGGADDIRNYQPLCEYHNNYVKNGKYTDYRPSKGKQAVKALKRYQENKPYQLSLMFPVARLDLANIDKPQIQPDFLYVLSDDRKREVWELRDFVERVRDTKNWYKGYAKEDMIESAYNRVDKILKRQETFYVSPITGEAIGIKQELHKLIPSPSKHPSYFDLQILYDETNVYWAKRFNEVNGTDYTPYEIYWANTEWYNFHSVEWDVEKLKKINVLDSLEYDKAERFAYLIREKIQDWKRKIDDTSYWGICHFLEYYANEVVFFINRYYR